jgi:hypothetical protein
MFLCIYKFVGTFIGPVGFSFYIIVGAVLGLLGRSHQILDFIKIEFHQFTDYNISKQK